MKAVNFKGSNKVLGRPNNMTEEECGPLNIHTSAESGCCLSKWEPSDEDRKLIAEGGGIWLWVYSGTNQPAVALSAENPYKGEDVEWGDTWND